MYHGKPPFRPAAWHLVGLAFIITLIMVAIKFFSTDPAGIDFIHSF